MSKRYKVLEDDLPPPPEPPPPEKEPRQIASEEIASLIEEVHKKIEQAKHLANEHGLRFTLNIDESYRMVAHYTGYKDPANGQEFGSYYWDNSSIGC